MELNKGRCVHWNTEHEIQVRISCRNRTLSPHTNRFNVNGKIFVRFEVFTAVTMKNGVFWDVTSCGSCKNRRFGGTQRLHLQGHKNRRTGNNVSRN
jgi:hypothetical protein